MYLGSSQYTYVEVCASQKLEDFVSCTENSLWFYGGVPKALMPDNLKSAVTKSSSYERQINEVFADFTEHYETAVLPTLTYRPRDKAIVENAMKIIHTRVFAPLRNQVFHGITDINMAIRELLEKQNAMPFRGREYFRRSLFMEIEKGELMPLHAKRYEIKRYAQAKVHKNSHIYFRSN